MLRRLLALLAFLLSLTTGVALAVAEPAVLIVAGEKTPAHDEALSYLRRELERGNGAAPSIRVVDSGEPEATRPPAATAVVVALGTRALQTVVGSEATTPLVALMVPRPAFERARAKAAARRASAVFIDQPLARQLALIAEALPEHRRLGALIGPDSQYWGEGLRAAARERALPLALGQVAQEEDLFPALQKVLGEARVLLALPDPLVFSGTTIHNILLTAYRREVPLVGFSPAYTRAGALLAIYSSPEQMALQAAEIVRQAVAGRALPAPQHPRDFRISVNRQVAQSLGLKVEAEEILERRLKQRETRE